MNPSAPKQAPGGNPRPDTANRAAGNPKTPFPRTIPIARFALS